MKILYPDYYDRFVCAADRCPDTCCAGWMVTVDEASARRYEKTEGSFGDLLRARMEEDAGEICFMPVNGRCPFLTGGGLCEIYTRLGKDALCETCAKYPRFDTDFGGRKELGLSLSCPEAARLILFGKGLPALIPGEDDAPVQPNETDPALYEKVMEARRVLFSMLWEERPLREIFSDMLLFAEHLQKRGKRRGAGKTRLPRIKTRREENWIGALYALDALHSGWKDTLREAERSPARPDRFPFLLRRLAAYYLYRYFSASVFDGDMLTPVKLAVFSCICVSSLAGEGEKAAAETAVSYSREVEHSEDNLRLLWEILSRDRRFTVRRMRRAL